MSTSSDDRNVSPPLYATEVRWLFDDPVSVERISNEFPDSTSAVLVRYLYFLSQTINRLEEEVNEQRQEYNDVFNYATENQQFRHHIRPILRAYRRRQAEPYPRSITPPSLQSDHTSPSPPSPSPLPLDTDSLASYDTAVDDTPGSSSYNPIDVDALEDPPQAVQFVTVGEETPRAGPSRIHRDTPHPNEGTLVRSRTLPTLLVCANCIRTGHTQSECIFAGPLICDYCNHPGHAQRSCPVLQRDVDRYNPLRRHCDYCGQNGHSQDECWAYMYPNRL